jgi:hypothetical protein
MLSGHGFLHRICRLMTQSRHTLVSAIARCVSGQMAAPLYRCYWCLQRASAKAPQKNIAPSTAANQAGGP